MASALAYMHGLKPPLIHRDLKPANVLIMLRRFCQGVHNALNHSRFCLD